MENDDSKQISKKIRFSELDQLDSDMTLAIALQQQERGFMDHLMMSETDSEGDVESFNSNDDGEVFDYGTNYVNLDDLEDETLDELEEEEGSDYQDMEEDEVDPDELSYEELIALGEVVGAEKKGLSPIQISSYLQPYSYKCQFNCENGRDQCVICQYEYEEEEQVVSLRCQHAYHSECISTWLQINKVCPICNVEVSPSEPVSDKTS